MNIRVKNVSIKALLLILSKYNAEYEVVDIVASANNVIELFPINLKEREAETGENESPSQLNPDDDVDDRF